MKAKLFLPILLLSITAIFYSCDKETQDKSKTDLLTQSAWKIIKTETDPGTGIYENEPLDDCAKDDIIKFNADHTYSATVGIKCDASEEDESGSWSFSADEKMLVIDSDAVNIETLNDNSLIVVASEDFGGITYKFKVTFGH